MDLERKVNKMSNKISIVQGTSKSLVDGVSVKHIHNDTYYFLDDILLAQVSFDLMTMKRELIVKANILTLEERDILDRLLVRLNLQAPKEQIIELYGVNGWKLD